VSTDVSVDLAEEWVAERRKGLVFEDAIPGVIAGKRAGMNGKKCIVGFKCVRSICFVL